MRKRLKKKMNYVCTYDIERRCVSPAEGGTYIDVYYLLSAVYVRNRKEALEVQTKMVEENRRCGVWRQVYVDISMRPGSLENAQLLKYWKYR